MNKKLAPTTVGTSDGAIILSNILNKKGKKVKREVLKTINTFSRISKEIYTSRMDPHTKRHLIVLLREEVYDNIDKFNLDSETETFTKNVLSTIYRKNIA